MGRDLLLKRAIGIGYARLETDSGEPSLDDRVGIGELMHQAGTGIFHVE
jgi:hypothetical protein